MAEDLNRPITVSTPAGDGVLLFRRMSGSEELGRLFRYDVDLLSETHDLDFNDILGQQMTIAVELPENKTRYFHGFVSEFQQTGDTGRFATYQATLRPWLWFLTQTSDCRIFFKEGSKRSVPEILHEVFSDHGYDVYVEDKLRGSDYRRWEYCVQYRETDFNFVSRLMEQEGIYYYFRHEDDKHILVLSDDFSAHEEFPGFDKIEFHPPTDKVTAHIDCVYGWTVAKSVQAGHYALNDFDFKKPKSGLGVVKQIPREHAESSREIYDYPGEYAGLDEGDRYARIRIEELQAEHERVQGQGNARGISVGSQFNLTGHHRDDQNREYLVVSALYTLVDTAYESGSAEVGTGFDVGFEVMVADEPFRTPRTTPKPIVQGPQTAVVVGKEGEEIWTDEYGRIKVQFHWDREAQADENSSCWIRVAQVWAGKKWGAMYIPRIGHEVIVDFLEGDPDKPIVTGRVYNQETMPPYDLPANKTMSTLKSNSSKGGQGFNEFRFQDKKGEEQIFLHGEKDLEIRVKNDRKEIIGNDRHLIVNHDRFDQVDNNLNLTVTGDSMLKVDGKVHQTLGADRMASIGANDNLTVAANQNLDIGGDINVEGGGSYNQKLSSKCSLDAGGDIHAKAGKNVATEAGMDVHIKAGMNATIEAGANLTIKVGGNFVSITPAGVAISGTTVMINSGGAAGSGGGSSPDAPASPDKPTQPTLPLEADTAEPGQVATAEAKDFPKAE